MRYTDREFCAAEKRGGIYGLTVGGVAYALTESGNKIPMPATVADQWRALPLDDPPVIGGAVRWTDEDEAAAIRAGAI